MLFEYFKMILRLNNKYDSYILPILMCLMY